MEESEPLDKFPPEIASFLGSLLNPDENVVQFFLSDIDEEGNFGQRWLIITTDKVVTINPETKHILKIPINDVQSAEAKDYVGNTELVVNTPVGPKYVIRSSRRYVEDLRKAAGLIDAIAKKKLLTEGLDLNEINHYWLRESKVGAGKAIKWLLGFLKPHWHYLALALTLALILTGFSLVPPYLMKILLDNALGNAIGSAASERLVLLSYIALALLGVYIANRVLGVIQNYFLAYLGQKLTYDIRISLYKHLQLMSLGFYDKFSAGRIMQRLMGDTGTVQWFLTWGLQGLIINSLMIAGIGFMIFTMNFRLALFALLPLPVILVGWPLFRKKSSKIYHRNWRRRADVNSLLWDIVPGAIIVKSFIRERFEIKRLIGKMQDLVKASMDTTVLGYKFFPILGFTISVGTVVIWWIGGQDVIAGGMSIGTLMAFITYMSMFYGPFNNLSNLFQPLQQSVTSAERILEVLNTVPEIRECPDAVAFDFRGSVEFKDITFGYNPYIPVVSNINFKVNPGETIGVVGPSGSGKTTLTKLVTRLYDPTEGKILIGGVDLKKIKLRCLRSQIGVVHQDSLLFYGSIAYNIAYAKRGATPEEIIAAAKAANVHNFAMEKTLRYDTNIGYRGRRLSGGEQQRVAIARTILFEPKVLILDEATSSVDTLAERQIHEAMENLSKGRTTIVIAHRLSTLQNADRIIVMDKGDIVEIGTHDELMKTGGLYSQLYDAQFAKEEQEPAVDALLAIQQR